MPPFSPLAAGETIVNAAASVTTMDLTLPAGTQVNEPVLSAQIAQIAQCFAPSCLLEMRVTSAAPGAEIQVLAIFTVPHATQAAASTASSRRRSLPGGDVASDRRADDGHARLR